MKSKKEIREELEELSPFLSKLKEEGDGFKVPNNYFKTLPDEVLKKAGIQSVKEVIPQTPQITWIDEFIISIQSLFQPRYAMAFASVAILIVAGLLLLNDKNTDLQFSDNIELDLSPEEIQAYISSNIDDFDSELFHSNDFSIEEINASTNEESLNEGDLLDEMLDEMDLDEIEELL